MSHLPYRYDVLLARTSKYNLFTRTNGPLALGHPRFEPRGIVTGYRFESPPYRYRFFDLCVPVLIGCPSRGFASRSRLKFEAADDFLTKARSHRVQI